MSVNYTLPVTCFYRAQSLHLNIFFQFAVTPMQDIVCVGKGTQEEPYTNVDDFNLKQLKEILRPGEWYVSQKRKLMRWNGTCGLTYDSWIKRLSYEKKRKKKYPVSGNAVG